MHVSKGDRSSNVRMFIKKHEFDKPFNFQQVENASVDKIISNLSTKKSVGVDKISVKLLKAGKTSFVPLVTSLVNTTLDTSIFPDKLKEAQVTPLFKKNDPLDKKNYRPVSVLNNISKVFEKVICEQLCYHFEGIFDNFLCAFRKGHGCQTVLLRILEDWFKHYLFTSCNIVYIINIHIC